jgi:hypothetical protein
MAETETVTVLRGVGRDAFGDPVAGATTETDVAGVLFAPGPSTEANFGQNRVDADATLYGPPGMDIVATDRVRARGKVYSVIGDPQDWGVEGVITALRRITGA